MALVMEESATVNERILLLPSITIHTLPDVSPSVVYAAKTNKPLNNYTTTAHDNNFALYISIISGK